MSFCEFTHSIFLNPKFKSQGIIIFSMFDDFFRIHFFRKSKSLIMQAVKMIYIIEMGGIMEEWVFLLSLEELGAC